MTVIVIEGCIEQQRQYALDERRRTHGRLILTDAPDRGALYFIHGWDELVRVDLWWLFNPSVKLRGAKLTASGDGLRPEAHVGREMLAEVADRSPAEQAEVVPSSRALPIAELSTAKLRRLPSRLIVETRRQGDTLSYRIPRARRAEVASWIAAAGLRRHE